MQESDHIREVRFACILLVAMFGAGVGLQLDYLAEEFRRLEPWKIAGLLCGDIAAFLWFARFAFLHAVNGVPLAPASPGTVRRGTKTVALIVLAALLFDVAFTVSLMRDARTGYLDGQVTEAQLVSVRERVVPVATWYELSCRFSDDEGNVHEPVLRVQAKKHVLPDALPEETVHAISGRHDGDAVIRVRYDTRFPSRAWVDGVGWDDGNAIYWFSLLTLMFQAMFAGVFLSLLRTHSTGQALPWWWETFKALPLAVQAFWMFAMGLIDWLRDVV